MPYIILLGRSVTLSVFQMYSPCYAAEQCFLLDGSEKPLMLQSRAEQYELPGDICAAFWARCLSCRSVHTLLHPTWHGCKPVCGLRLQATWEQVGREISALCCPLPRTILQCRWHSRVSPDLADPCTSFLPTAIPGEERTILRKVPKSQSC